MPLDALVLSDGPRFAGCLILGKVLGVLQPQQTGGKDPIAMTA